MFVPHYRMELSATLDNHQTKYMTPSFSMEGMYIDKLS